MNVQLRTLDGEAVALRDRLGRRRRDDGHPYAAFRTFDFPSVL